MSAGLKLFLKKVFRKDFLTGLMHGFAFISALLYFVPILPQILVKNTEMHVTFF